MSVIHFSQGMRDLQDGEDDSEANNNPGAPGIDGLGQEYKGRDNGNDQQDAEDDREEELLHMAVHVPDDDFIFAEIFRW